MLLLSFVQSLVISLCIFLGIGVIYDTWVPTVLLVSCLLGFFGAVAYNVIEEVLVKIFNRD